MNIADLVAIRTYYGGASGIMKVIRDANRRVAYIGYAPRGTLVSDAMWNVVKMAYDSNGDFDYFLVSKERQILTDYVSLEYGTALDIP